VRSELVFTAADRIPNPFLLCHLVRISSRRCHEKGGSIQETINRALRTVLETDSVSSEEVAEVEVA
jgi:hypothetical protein